MLVNGLNPELLRLFRSVLLPLEQAANAEALRFVSGEARIFLSYNGQPRSGERSTWLVLFFLAAVIDSRQPLSRANA